MQKKERILLAAVKLGRFTRRELVAESGQTANTVHDWVREARAARLIVEVGSLHRKAAGSPQLIYVTRPEARKKALRSAEVYQELARLQYAEGRDHGFVDPPKLDAEKLLAPAEAALRASITAFRKVVNLNNEFPLMEVKKRQEVHGCWARSCASTGDDDFAMVHGFRRDLFDSIRSLDLLIADWEGVGIAPPPMLVSRARSIHATAQDPRAFVIAAAFEDLAEACEKEARKKNAPTGPHAVQKIAHMLAEEAFAEARLTRETGRFHTQAMREVPALRLFYALDWSGNFEQLTTECLAGEGGCASRIWWSVLALTCAQARDVGPARPSAIQGHSINSNPDSIESNVAQAALSAVASRLGWGKVAAAISALPRLLHGGAPLTDRDSGALWWVVARIAFALHGEIRCKEAARKDTRPSGDDLLRLKGAMLELQGSALWPEFCDPLIALLHSAHAEHGGGGTSHLGRYFGGSRLDQLARQAHLSAEMMNQLELVRARGGSSSERATGKPVRSFPPIEDEYRLPTIPDDWHTDVVVPPRPAIEPAVHA
jgi:hypothetical protein